MLIYNALSHAVATEVRYYGDLFNNILVSYFVLQLDDSHVNGLIGHHKMTGRQFFLDSGAFSAFNSGAEIDIRRYETFIKDHSGLFSCYANLDVIGDPDGTADNQTYLEDVGLTPLPVFHYGSDYNILEEMCDQNECIALGKLVPLSSRKNLLRRHLDNCFSITSQNKNKIHLFGTTAKWCLERYPCYSADSTSAFEGSMRGTVTQLSTSMRLNPRNNITAFSLMDRNDQDKRYRERVRYMFKETVVLEKYITRLWETRGIVWD